MGESCSIKILPERRHGMEEKGGNMNTKEFEMEIERRIACLSRKIDKAYDESRFLPTEMGWEEGQVEAYEQALELYRR